MAVTQPHQVGETRTEKGISLARGPALILGTILLAAGLYFLYKQHNFPKFSTNFPNGDAPVDGKVFGIFGANGWTGMLTAVAGGLLLFGAAQHLLAKTMSLIVGVALGAAAVIAAINGDVLGMAAANAWTEIAWGAAAAILLFNTIIPRRRRTVNEYGYAAAGAPAADHEYAASGGRYAGDDTEVMPDRAAPVAAGERGYEDERRYDAADARRYDDADGDARRYDDQAETRVTDREAEAHHDAPTEPRGAVADHEEPATERVDTVPDHPAEDETREIPAARRDETTSEP